MEKVLINSASHLIIGSLRRDAARWHAAHASLDTGGCDRIYARMVDTLQDDHLIYPSFGGGRSPSDR